MNALKNLKKLPTLPLYKTSSWICCNNFGTLWYDAEIVKYSIKAVSRSGCALESGYATGCTL